MSGSRFPVVRLSEVLGSGGLRLDASYYVDEAREAEKILSASGYPLEPLGDLAERIFYPSRFRRVWVKDREHGYPYLSPSELLYFKPLHGRFISKRTKDAPNFFAQEGWILLTRSGIIGVPIYVTQPLTKYFISDDLIRIVPREGILSGYLYAYFSSSIAKALIRGQEYGMTVMHIEPEHVRPLPVPRLPHEIERRIHDKIVMAWQRRAEANKLEEEAIQELESLLTKLSAETS